MDKIEQNVLDGRMCWHAVFAYRQEPDYIIYFPCGKEELDLLPQIYDMVMPKIKNGECRPFVLAGFLSDDWNKEFSPWPADSIFSKAETFVGGGKQTLEWMEQTLIPATEAQLAAKPKRRAIVGYSLAGLFALWAVYNTSVFNDCGGCSASLWYPGWEEYVVKRTPSAVDRIYLSLGKKEEKARNTIMATVGQKTQLTKEYLEKSVPDVFFEWNEGGHFTEVDSRIAKALVWLAQL